MPALLQIMAWHQTDSKTLSEMIRPALLTYLVITQSEWVNNLSWWYSFLRPTYCFHEQHFGNDYTVYILGVSFAIPQWNGVFCNKNIIWNCRTCMQSILSYIINLIVTKVCFQTIVFIYTLWPNFCLDNDLPSFSSSICSSRQTSRDDVYCCGI